LVLSSCCALFVLGGLSFNKTLFENLGEDYSAQLKVGIEDFFPGLRFSCHAFNIRCSVVWYFWWEKFEGLEG